MNRSGIVALSAGLLAATVGVCWLVAGMSQRAQQASPKARAESGSDPDALRAVLGQVQSLKAQVEGLEARHEASVTLQAATPAPTTEQAPSAVPAAPPPLESAAVAASYETIFDQERADSAWSANEQRAISDLFARGVEGARLQKAECRENMCRVSVQFTTAAARQKFISGAIGQPPFDHGGFFHTDEATGAFTMFSAREGRTLPAVQ